MRGTESRQKEKPMKARNLFLAALLLMVAGIQTAAAQGFRVYKSDGTVAQFSFRTDSIVFYDGIGTDVDFGPFTPVNQCIVGTWYRTKSETVTFSEDGTTDYLAGATYEFLPYQGTLIINNAEGKLTKLLRVPKVTKDYIMLSEWGGETFAFLTVEQPGQLVTGITVSPASLTLDVGETAAIAATAWPADADNKEVEWSSSDEAVAVVGDFFGTITVMAKGYGSCTITATAKDGSGVKGTCKVTVKETGINGHAYVEIGGLKWATMNVGASTVAGSYSTCYGDYYAWGETEPYYEDGYADENPQTHWKTGKTGYDWASYQWTTDGGSSFTKYTGSDYDTLQAADDAATAAYGSPYRMPTDAEFQELLNASNCDGEWVANYLSTGVNGYLFTGKKSGYESQKLFLPAAGYRYYTYLFSVGSGDSYWSSAPGSGDNPNYAWFVYFSSGKVYRLGNDRCVGHSVRPVSE
mgnify:CR=1 FL=1